MEEVFEKMESWAPAIALIALIFCVAVKARIDLLTTAFLFYLAGYVFTRTLADFSWDPGFWFPTLEGQLGILWIWAWSIGGLVCASLLLRERKIRSR